MDMRNWDLFDQLLEILGGEKLAEEFISYMDSDTANRYLEAIAREYEIENEEFISYMDSDTANRYLEAIAREYEIENEESEDE